MNTELDGIFRPRSIAVIGASSKRGTIGHSILHNLIEYSFNGKVFPVNPKANVIHSIKCYSTILDVPDAVDLAIIIVPADHVGPILEQCGDKGVKGVVVISSGFKEVGEDGVAKEEALLKIIRKYRMRMIGPNCFGVLNTDLEYSMNATFSKAQPLRGRIGFMSQSGALGEAILGLANDLNLGFSMFASVGNKADISGNDILAYWADDPNTDVILMYLESFGDPREFTRIARELSRKKPIVAVKAGRTAAGARAVSSHTGVLAGLDVGTDALLEQCGVTRVTSIDELFDVAGALSNQPIPRGDRIAVITNAGGPGILATDAVVNLGMKMATFDKKTTKILREKLPLVASVNNPVDVIAAGGPDSYRIAMDAVLSDPNVDAVIVIFVPPVVVDHKAVIDEIVAAIDNDKNQKTVLGCFMAIPSGIAGSEAMIKHKIPIYTFPESAAKAMSALVRRRRWIDRPMSEPQAFKAHTKVVQQIIDNARADNRQTIIGGEALGILDAYGVNVARSIRTETAREACVIAGELGFPVIMKVDGPEVLHKTEVGGVSTDLRSAEEVSLAFESMRENCETAQTGFSGVIIQELITGAVETIIGMNHDPAFGPLIMFGLGGIFVEVMKDVTFKVHPVTPHDAREMLESIKGYPLLNGFRGAPAVDFDCLAETILRLSQLVTDFPEIDSFDVNPFFAAADRKNSKAVDARFMLRLERPRIG
ncbi:MAG: acetate--CoA ligase family protein [candidate division Zixibacteria bacterium]|nr:acetate--CoA ligase family protein [candidate division Zixibacteria bacterium]MDH3938183.1 acetate--CoA ligase family protein [candidate division Zixibacteria bacterium]MDH4034201.1 acetate--CoA ligase family protein [candidate division Zixibacteria bacterium]